MCSLPPELNGTNAREIRLKDARRADIRRAKRELHLEALRRSKNINKEFCNIDIE